MKRRKQADKRARRRGSAAPIPVAPSPAITRPVLPTRISELPSVMTDMTALTTGTLSGKTAKKSKFSPRPTKKDQTVMPLDTTSPIASNLTAASVAPSMSATEAVNAPAAPPTPSAKPAGAAPVHTPLQDGVSVIPEDVLALAMRIATGEMNQITITADMVGRTFFYDGTIVQVGGAGRVVTPASVAAEAPAAAAEAAPAAVGTPRPAITKKQGIILDTLKSLGGFVPVADLVTLHAEGMGYKNARSAHASIAAMLAKLQRDGLISCVMDGNRQVFRKI